MKETFFCVKDILYLYTHSAELALVGETDSANRFMIIFNDCKYISNHVMTLGYYLKQFLAPEVASYATFIDIIHVTRKLGRRMFEKSVKMLSQGLVQRLLIVQDDLSVEDVETGIKNAIKYLMTSSFELKGLLEREDYMKLIGFLIDRLVSFFVELKVVKELDSLDWLDRRTVKQLAHDIRTLEDCFSFTHAKAFNSAIDTSASTSLKAEKYPISKYATSWSSLDIFIA